MSIDFTAINKAALAHCPGLLERLLPGGRIENGEYRCGDITGGDGRSFGVHLTTGKWGDMTTGEGGGDLVSLVAAQQKISQGEAAKFLLAMIGEGSDTAPMAKPQKAAKEKPPVIMPVPDDVAATVPAMRHYSHGEPTEYYAYRNTAGLLLGYKCRFTSTERNDKGKHKKGFAPMVYTATKGWQFQGFPEPFPFYGLDCLPELPTDAPIVIVEGEHKADALKSIMGATVGVLGLPGSGSADKMDYGPLLGRRLYYWPDNDAPGYKAALVFAEKALPVAASVHMVKPPADKPETWDVADAIEKDGWTSQRIIDWIAGNKLDPEEFAKEADRRFDMAPEAAAKNDNPPLVCVNIADFLRMEIPKREAILAPVLIEKGHAMIFAMRGTGKTYAALSIAWAVASGGEVFGRWKAPRPWRVLLLDGEMPAQSLKERIMAIGHASDTDITMPPYLRIISADMQPEGLPSLSRAEGQQAVAPYIKDADLVILDNLATLAPECVTNKSEDWLPMQMWLLELRRKGKTALLIHHANKSGDQRGSIAREDIIESSICLKHPADYKPEDGARFEVHYTKHRNFYGKEAMPFEAKLTNVDGKQKWITRTLENVEMERLKELLDQGYTIRDCAEEMGCSKSKIDRMRKQITNSGL